MKNTLLLTALSATLLFANSSQAQIPGVGKITKALPKVDLGLKLGANFNQLQGTNFQNAYKAGITGGAFVGLRKGSIGVRVEGMISTVKYTYSYGIAPATLTGSFKNVNFDMPVLFEYKLISRLWAQIGPQFSNTLSVNASPSVNDPNSYFKSNFAGVLGLQARLPFHLVAGARYVLGVTNINNESVSKISGSWNARTIQIFVGFRFI